MPSTINRRTFHKSLTVLASTALAQGISIPSSFASTGVPSVPREPKWKKANAKAYGEQLAHYAKSYDAGWKDSYIKTTIKLIDAQGKMLKRSAYQMGLEREDGNRGLVRFTAPSDIKGVSVLSHEHANTNDEHWLYLPSSRRVRRISGANRTASFQGTEFTYEDLASIEPRRYSWKYLSTAELTSDGKKVKVLRLEASPKYKETGYKKLIFSLNPESYRAEKIEFFDLAGRPLKALTFSRWKLVHKRFHRAAKMHMINLQTHKETIMEIDSLLLNVALYPGRDGQPRPGLDPNLFSRQALAQG